MPQHVVAQVNLLLADGDERTAAESLESLMLLGVQNGVLVDWEFPSGPHTHLAGGPVDVSDYLLQCRPREYITKMLHDAIKGKH